MMAMVMILSLTVIAAADDEAVFEYTSQYALQIGWTTLFGAGSDEALALYGALAEILLSPLLWLSRLSQLPREDNQVSENRVFPT